MAWSKSVKKIFKTIGSNKNNNTNYTIIKEKKEIYNTLVYFNNIKKFQNMNYKYQKKINTFLK